MALGRVRFRQGKYYLPVPAPGATRSTSENYVHDGIANLARHGALAAIVTTNFDQLIEQALTACGIRFKVAYETKTYRRALQLASDPPNEPLVVLKVHGSVHDHRSMVEHAQAAASQAEQEARAVSRSPARKPPVDVHRFLGRRSGDQRRLPGHHPGRKGLAWRCICAMAWRAGFESRRRQTAHDLRQQRRAYRRRLRAISRCTVERARCARDAGSARHRGVRHPRAD